MLHDVSVELLAEPKQALTVRLMASDPMDAIEQVNRMSREQALALAVPERTTPGKDPHPAGNTPGIWTPNYEFRPQV